MTGAYVLSAWQHDQDPTTDYAVLTVAPNVVNGRRPTRRRHRQRVTRRSTAGRKQRDGCRLQRRTQRRTRHVRGQGVRVKGFPTFDCHGFVGGSSGSPWLTIDANGHATIHGVIGGLKQGGCHEYRSHSSAFNDAVRTSSIAPRPARTRTLSSNPTLPGVSGQVGCRRRAHCRASRFCRDDSETAATPTTNDA